MSEPHEDPNVRAKVFETVTTEEAWRILHSRAGKPWCDAMLYGVTDGLANAFTGEDEHHGRQMRDGAAQVAGFRPADPRPPASAPKSAWVRFAVETTSIGQAAAEGLTKAQLIHRVP